MTKMTSHDSCHKGRPAEVTARHCQTINTLEYHKVLIVDHDCRTAAWDEDQIHICIPTPGLSPQGACVDSLIWPGSP